MRVAESGCWGVCVSDPLTSSSLECWGTNSWPPQRQTPQAPGRPPRVRPTSYSRLGGRREGPPISAPPASPPPTPAIPPWPPWERQKATTRGEGRGRRERSCKSHDFPAYINHSLFFSAGCRLKGVVSAFSLSPRGRGVCFCCPHPPGGLEGVRINLRNTPHPRSPHLPLQTNLRVLPFSWDSGKNLSVGIPSSSLGGGVDGGRQLCRPVTPPKLKGVGEIARGQLWRTVSVGNTRR